MSRHLWLVLVYVSVLVVVGFAPPPALAGAPGQGRPAPVRDASEERVQHIPVGTAQIGVTVTAASTGRPLRNVIVTLSGSASLPSTPGGSIPGRADSAAFLQRVGVTDGYGHVLFDRLPAGRFTLEATRRHFLPATYGRPASGRPPSTIALSGGQRLTLSIEMIRRAVIAGVILSDDGDPAPGAHVQLYQYSWRSGVRQLAASAGTMTDDRGTFRLAGLEPGEYFLAATPNSDDLLHLDFVRAEREAFAAAVARTPAGFGASAPSVLPMVPPSYRWDSSGYAPTYFPGTASFAGAAPIRIGAGEERLVEFQVLPVRTGSVRGTVSVPPGLTEVVRVSLRHTDPAMRWMPLPSSRISEDGTFILHRVPPGTYTVMATTSPVVRPHGTTVVVNGVETYQPEPVRSQVEPPQRFWARSPVDVHSHSAADVVLQLQPGRSISGVILPDSTARLDPTPGAVQVIAVPADHLFGSDGFGPPQAEVRPDGRFHLAAVPPGRYVLRLNGGAGSVKSVMSRGIDTLDFPLEVADQDVTDVVITLTARPAELTGRLTETTGAPARDYTIIVAAEDRRYWTPHSRRVAATRSRADGTYVVRELPPGHYFVAALTDLEYGREHDPALLAALRGAGVRVTIREGGRHVQDLRVAAPPP